MDGYGFYGSLVHWEMPLEQWKWAENEKTTGSRLPPTVLQRCGRVAANQCHAASSTPASAREVSKFCKESLSLLTLSLSQRKRLWLDSKSREKNKLIMANNTARHDALGSGLHGPRGCQHSFLISTFSGHCMCKVQSVNYCVCLFSYVYSLKQHLFWQWKVGGKCT